MTWITQQQAHLIRHMHALGYRAYPLNLGFGRGCAGILAQASNGSGVFVLLKRAKQHLPIGPTRWLLRLRSGGFLVFTAETVREVDKALAGQRL